MTIREVEHEITVQAPAAEVYRLIAEVENWPRIFPPTIHVEQEPLGEGEERIRIWATANEQPKHWTSHRRLDPGARRIEFRQEVSTPPVAAMGGTWVIEELSAEESRVRLLHDYRAIDDDPGKLAWIDEAVDTNSRSELAALKTNIERATADADLLVSFEDTVRMDASVQDIYDFINEAQHWQERLPHVARVRLDEDTPGLQTLEMDTLTKDGDEHTTRSYRVCFPHHKIAYKQTVLPELLALHTGHWLIEETEDGVAVTSQHTAVLVRDKIKPVCGPDVDPEQAREFVRINLSTNSRATLGYAKDYAEAKAEATA